MGAVQWRVCVCAAGAGSGGVDVGVLEDGASSAVSGIDDVRAEGAGKVGHGERGAKRAKGGLVE